MSKEGVGKENTGNVDEHGDESGVRLKMPAPQLAQVTKAKNKLEEHLDNDSHTYETTAKSLQKYEDEVTKLEKQCGLILTLNDVQQQQKQEWIDKNVVHLRAGLHNYKQRLADKWQRVGAPPEIVISKAADKAEASQKSAKSVKSLASRKSNASSLARQAEAELAALHIEKERMLKRQKQEEQERLLRQRREQEDLEAKIQQAQVRQEALSRAGSRASDISEASSRLRRRTLLELPAAPQRTREWISNAGPAIEPLAADSNCPQQAVNADAATVLYQQTLLPSSKLPIFRGNYLEFPWFIRSYEMIVESVTSDPMRRLHLLLQHLEGEPHTLVKGFHLAEPSLAFQLAKQELVQRYGNPIRQSLAFKEQLLSWPDVKKDSSGDLERFFVQLRLCQAMKLSGAGMNELDSTGTLVKLMHKLPQKHQEGWLRRVHRIESHNNRETNYDDFTQFVRELSETANHPVFKTSNRHDKGAPKKSITLATHANFNTEAAENKVLSANEPDIQPETSDLDLEMSAATGTQAPPETPKDAFKPPCLMCARNHPTSECQSYDTVPLAERKVRLKGLCFRCLKGDHWARHCKKPSTCGKCEGKHPTMLHDEVRAPKDKAATTTGNSSETCGATISASPGSGCVAAVPVKVWLTSSSAPILTQAILDTASSTSFISEALASKLGIQLRRNTSLKLSTVMETATTNTSIIRGLKVTDIDGNEVLELPAMYSLPTLPSCVKSTTLRREVEKWNHLLHVPFAWDQYSDEVGLLLGQDVPDALCPLQVVRSPRPNEPYAALSPLGWTFNGPRIELSSKNITQATSTVESSGIEAALQRLYYNGMENLFNFNDKGPSLDDQEWMRLVEATVRRAPLSPERYEIALPFRADVTLYNNYKQAERQLQTLKRKFVANEQFKRDYLAFIKKMEDEGYVERVTQQDDAAEFIHYIPHHGVYHPRKPGKLRVVFNCSNKYQGVSLNDCLLSGPDLTNSLLGVLLRFRQEAVAFIADVESMFYRVFVPENQRDALRYLWWPGGDVDQAPQVFRMTVHLFGATSSPSCANYALRKAADDALQENLVNEAARNAVHRNFYVDDCLKSAATEEEAMDIALGLIKACQHGGFNLAKFASTSPALLKALPPQCRSQNVTQADLEDKHNPLMCQERALGVAWDVKADTFYFKLKPNVKVETTKRSILSTLSTVYDPLGMAAPVIITARILFRNLAADKGASNWDEQIEETKALQWSKWLKDLPGIEEVRLPRCYGRTSSEQEQPWQLHAFCDSSLDAYSVVIYIRHGQVNATVSFVLGKARVTPPKIATIPRLELTAAKLATDMMRTVQQELQLPIAERTFWSDSQTVLKYLNCKSRRFHTFVANRVHSILASSTTNEWRFVPSGLNPADEATRGLSAQDLPASKWIHGPPFLRQPETQWPEQQDPTEPEPDDKEVKDIVVAQTHTTSTSFVLTMAERYSSLHKFKKAIAIWAKFKQFLRCAAQITPLNTATDLEVALIEALKWLQYETWPEEIASLQKGNQVTKKSVLWKLSPALIDGLVVMRSRTRTTLPIVPAGRLGNLIVTEAHVRQLHYGRQSTAAAVLRQFWVIGLNKAVRKIIKECPSCQLRHAQPKPEEMSTLPHFRLDRHGHAFATTGVDYFGPFTVKYGARSTTKTYGVIFTCATTRAIHLEAAEDLSASGFINALRRFVARRGPTQQFISDNGTNFKGAKGELDEELQDELARQAGNPQISTELRKQGIEWTFNAPGASHHGGFWERMIRSIRRAFEALLQVYQPLTVTNFATLLCEIEAALNARPLTTVSEDPNDLDALTPNHLLLLRSGPQPLPGDYSSPASLRQHWRHIQHLAQTFWKRWAREYYVLLHRRTTWLDRNKRPLRPGDVVLMLDPLRHRRYWSLGRVKEICSSNANQPRVVRVQTQNGIFLRPINKLCLLETASELNN